MHGDNSMMNVRSSNHPVNEKSDEDAYIDVPRHRRPCNDIRKSARVAIEEKVRDLDERKERRENIQEHLKAVFGAYASREEDEMMLPSRYTQTVKQDSWLSLALDMSGHPSRHNSKRSLSYDDVESDVENDDEDEDDDEEFHMNSEGDSLQNSASTVEAGLCETEKSSTTIVYSPKEDIIEKEEVYDDILNVTHHEKETPPASPIDKKRPKLRRHKSLKVIRDAALMSPTLCRRVVVANSKKLISSMSIRNLRLSGQN